MLPEKHAKCDSDGDVKSSIRALAEAFWPRHPEEAAAAQGQEHVYWQTSGADFDVAVEVMDTIRNCIHGINQVALVMVLHLLQWRLGTLLLAGRHCLSTCWPFILCFAEMSIARRQAMLTSWARSRLLYIKQAFKAFKSIIFAMLFSVVDEKGRNPFWAAMHYTPGTDVPLIAEPLASACEAEEVLASAVVHLPELLAMPGLNVRAFLSKRGFSTTADDLLTHSHSTPTASAPNNSTNSTYVRINDHSNNIHDSAPTANCSNGEAASGQPTQGLPAAEALELHADAVVLGSGAGGGAAAAVLAAAGMKVLVVEKSTWRKLSDLTWMERESSQAMYEASGFVMTECSGISLLAGSTLGGGTKINWTVSFSTPDHVRREWATEHGLRCFAPGPGPFTDALDAVCKRLGVRTDNHHNAPNAKLVEGLAAIGGKPEAMPRNCLAPEECSSYCALGCKKGGKQSSDVTFLADAVRHGARIITGCYAERVLVAKQKGAAADDAASTRSKRATGVVLAAVINPHTGQQHQRRIIVHAPIVVASCGSLHTPALLLRSGLHCNGNVGKHLHVHPACGVVCKYPMADAHRTGTARGPMDMHLGPPMSACSKAVADWEGSGYGGIVSVPCTHPGMLGCLATWTPSLKKDLLPISNIALNVVYTRDMTEGRVCIDGLGRPRLHYWPNQQDRDNILKGMELAMRAGVAAGAVKVSVPYLTDMAYEVGFDLNEAKLNAYIEQLWATGLKHTDASLFSAHQMGSARMGSSPRTSVCDANGECWEVSGLHIADASAFPTASGVNPMITAASIAYMNAQAIVRQHKARQQAAVAAA